VLCLFLCFLWQHLCWTIHVSLLAADDIAQARLALTGGAAYNCLLHVRGCGPVSRETIKDCTVMEKELKDRAKAIRDRILQLRDSL